MTRYFSFIILLSVSFAVYSQDKINFDEIKAKYSKYNAVILSIETQYLFDIVDDTLSVRENFSKDVVILNEYAKGFTNDYVYYGSFSSIEDLKAESLIPKGNGYERIKVKQFDIHHDDDRNTFYDDTKEIQFAYPSLTQGAITKLSYTSVYSNPRFIGNSFFQAYVPLVKSKVIVKVHRDIKLGFKIFNQKLIDIGFKQYSKGKYNYYEWEVKDIPPYKYLVTNHFSLSHFSPHINLFVEEFKSNGKVQKYYGKIDDLHKFYNGFLARMNNSSSDELKSLVDSITAQKSEIEKVKAVYYWVQDNVKYIAYSEGYQGFVPSDPVEVFKKRYGDCKGMSGLIRKMLEIANLKAYLAWVGTRRIPYSYYQLPLPLVDNHMVVAYPINDTFTILDGTFNYLDFGIPPYHIQGKEVMVSLDSNNYKIYKVPVFASSNSKIIDSVNIVLSGNVVEGYGRRTHTGFNKYELASALEGQKVNDYPKRFSKLFAMGNNKFKIDTVNVKNVFEREQPSEVRYCFKINDYTSSFQDEIYINLNLDKSLSDMRIDTSSFYSPISNDFQYEEKRITRFKIPDGYEVKYMPQSDSGNFGFLRFSLDYRLQKDFIVLEKVIYYDFLIILKDKFNDWNKMVDQLNKNYRSTLVLKKK